MMARALRQGGWVAEQVLFNWRDAVAQWPVDAQAARLRLQKTDSCFVLSQCPSLMTKS